MKLILLSHERELSKKSNSGRIVSSVLGEAAKVVVWKRKEPDDSLIKLFETKRAALVFPTAEHKNQELVQRRFDYFVLLDATWQQARKMYKQSPYLKTADKVSIRVSKPSEYKLRRNQIEGGLSTAECVIELLRVHGPYEKLAQLEDLYQRFNTQS